MARPAAAMTAPAGTTALGPKRGTSTLVAICAATIRAPIIGRKARPVLTGV